MFCENTLMAAIVVYSFFSWVPLASHPPQSDPVLCILSSLRVCKTWPIKSCTVCAYYFKISKISSCQKNVVREASAQWWCAVMTQKELVCFQSETRSLESRLPLPHFKDVSGEILQNIQLYRLFQDRHKVPIQPRNKTNKKSLSSYLFESCFCSWILDDSIFLF